MSKIRSQCSFGNTAITKDNLEGDYDKVILAAGSTPAMPPIPGN